MFSDTMMLGGSGRKAPYPMENSLLFRGGQYFTRTPSVAGDRKTWTWSCWVRFGALGSTFNLLNAGLSNTNEFEIRWTSADGTIYFYEEIDTAVVAGVRFAPALRDPTAWCHLVIVCDTTQVISANRVKCYVNGAQVGTQGTPIWPSLNYDTYVNGTTLHTIGRRGTVGDLYMDGYLAEPILVDGAALPASVFGETDPVTLSWRPKKISGVTYGPNGCYLGAPWNVIDLGKDYGGLTTAYAMDPSTKGGLVTLSNGGLTVSTTAVVGQGPQMNAFGTDRVVAGKRVFELKVEQTNVGVGVAVYPGTINVTPTIFCLRYSNTIQITGGSQPTSSLGMLAVGDVVRVEFDASAGICTFYRNGTFEYAVPGLTLGVAWRPYYAVGSSGVSSQGTFRFDPATFTSGTPSAGYTQWTSGNSWTPSGFAATDVVLDNPTNVYATLNSLWKGANVSLSEGNLKVDTGTADDWSYGTVAIPSSGKWVWEVKVESASLWAWLGIGDGAPPTSNFLAYYGNTGAKYVNGVQSAYGAAYGMNSVIGIVADPVAGTITYYKDGVSQGAVSYPCAGYFPYMSDGASGAGTVYTVNFGQRVFAYPSAYGSAKPLCTANLPATTGKLTGTFTGNGSADGPYVYTGAVPVTLTINGNAVVWGTHADKLATGFKIRTTSASYNSGGANSWTATYNKQPAVGSNHTPANAQMN